jgi:hypothetical protein
VNDLLTMIDEDVKERVLRGIKLLNKHYPGWESEVDPNWLDLGSAHSCVLGQLYRDKEPTEEQLTWFRENAGGVVDGSGYSNGLAILNNDVAKRPWYYGFDTDADDSYPELTEAWVELAEMTGERDRYDDE